jgi:hypothetical protein
MMRRPPVAMTNFMATHPFTRIGDLATRSHWQCTPFDHKREWLAIHCGAPHLNFVQIAWMLNQLALETMIEAFGRYQLGSFLGNDW